MVVELAERHFERVVLLKPDVAVGPSLRVVSKMRSAKTGNDEGRRLGLKILIDQGFEFLKRPVDLSPC